jgi:hypothetical protein
MSPAQALLLSPVLEAQGPLEQVPYFNLPTYLLSITLYGPTLTYLLSFTLYGPTPYLLRPLHVA